MRREIDLVDHQQVRAGDAGPALGRDLVAGRDVDHVDRQVGQLRRERRREIVAAGLDQHEIEIGKLLPHLGHRREVDRGVLADRRVRAAAGLDAGDALGRERAGAHQIFGVPLGVDVVGDGGDLESCRAAACTAHPSARSCPSRPGRRHRREEVHGSCHHALDQEGCEADREQKAERAVPASIHGRKRLVRRSAGATRACRPRRRARRRRA